MRRLLLFAFLLIATPLAAQPATPCASDSATAVIEGRDVRARLYTNGALFWRGSGNVYEVGGADAVFNTSFWIGGLVGDEPRVSATDYGPWEMWPGPLGSDGNPPADCAPHDRIYLVTTLDIARYRDTGEASDDLRDWPAHLGAPTVDGDGISDNYDLAAGDRPQLFGDQTAWWVMNDAGGDHGTTRSDPIQMEVQVTAYAFNQSGPLGETTFYRYRLVYRGSEPLTNAWTGFYADVDLGNASDDYMATDSTRNMAYVYNGDDLDSGSAGYGAGPPALGYRFLETPPDANGQALGMTRAWIPTGSKVNFGIGGSPESAYDALQGIWRGGVPLRRTARGYAPPSDDTSRVVRFVYPSDPLRKTFWSDFAPGRDSGPNTPTDRTLALTTGPFTMQPGQSHDLTLAIIYGRGADHLDSIVKLRANADGIAAAWADGLSPNPLPPPPPQPPVLTVISLRHLSEQPASSLADFELGSGVDQAMRVEVYDAMGRRMSTLFDGEMSLDERRTLTLDTSRFAPGVYFVHARGRYTTATRELIVVR